MALKDTVKSLVKRAAIQGGLEAVALAKGWRLWPAAGGRGLVFTLHHVRPAELKPHDPNALLSVAPQFLDMAIQASLECGLAPVALEDLPTLLADPADPRRFVCFTLDDGYRDNAEHAAPVFRKHGAPYTIFITKGFVERTRSLWWETVEQLTGKATQMTFDFGGGAETVAMDTPARKLAAFERLARFVQTGDEDAAIERLARVARTHGVDPLGITEELVMNAGELRELARDPLARFGAHTLTHVALARLDESRLREEISGSADAVANYVGQRPTTFAYPYGFPAAVGEREFRMLAELGFTVGVTTQPGVLGRRSIERPTAISRVSLNGLYQKKRYVKALISGIPFRLM
jgi:peptidoglycan/xylan/chitin deacetylase (PgdA/CDA1 family)